MWRSSKEMLVPFDQNSDQSSFKGWEGWTYFSTRKSSYIVTFQVAKAMSQHIVLLTSQISRHPLSDVFSAPRPRPALEVCYGVDGFGLNGVDGLRLSPKIHESWTLQTLSQLCPSLKSRRPSGGCENNRTVLIVLDLKLVRFGPLLLSNFRRTNCYVLFCYLRCVERHPSVGV